jgi:hypothetical protein
MSFKKIGFALAGLALAACGTSTPLPTTGPGATLKCAGGSNAFSTYGAAAFVKVNQAIFANVGTEMSANGTKNLGSSFTIAGTGNIAATKDDLPTFEGKLAAFLVFAYGGPTSITYTDGKTYVGNDQDMITAHTGFDITADQYNYFVTSVIVPALEQSGVPAADVTACFAPVVMDQGFVSEIVGH